MHKRKQKQERSALSHERKTSTKIQLETILRDTTSYNANVLLLEFKKRLADERRRLAKSMSQRSFLYLLSTY